MGLGRVLVFDIQGWITLILGGLPALITLFSSYSHVHVPFAGTRQRLADMISLLREVGEFG